MSTRGRPNANNPTAVASTPKTISNWSVMAGATQFSDLMKGRPDTSRPRKLLIGLPPIDAAKPRHSRLFRLCGLFPDGESTPLERIQHVGRQPGYPLQILPGLEGTILETMLHDLLGIVFTDALNNSQFLFSSFVQIHVFRHNIS